MFTGGAKPIRIISFQISGVLLYIDYTGTLLRVFTYAIAGR
jgi:hypothetical protein